MVAPLFRSHAPLFLAWLCLPSRPSFRIIPGSRSSCRICRMADNARRETSLHHDRSFGNFLETHVPQFCHPRGLHTSDPGRIGREMVFHWWKHDDASHWSVLRIWIGLSKATYFQIWGGRICLRHLRTLEMIYSKWAFGSCLPICAHVLYLTSGSLMDTMNSSLAISLDCLSEPLRCMNWILSFSCSTVWR